MNFFERRVSAGQLPGTTCQKDSSNATSPLTATWVAGHPALEWPSPRQRAGKTAMNFFERRGSAGQLPGTNCQKDSSNATSPLTATW
jgi:hypothetical protein